MLNYYQNERLSSSFALEKIFTTFSCCVILNKALIQDNGALNIKDLIFSCERRLRGNKKVKKERNLLKEAIRLVTEGGRV